MKLRTVREASISSKSDFPTVVMDGDEVKLINGAHAEAASEATDDLDEKLAAKRQEEAGGPASVQS